MKLLIDTHCWLWLQAEPERVHVLVAPVAGGVVAVPHELLPDREHVKQGLCRMFIVSVSGIYYRHR